MSWSWQTIADKALGALLNVPMKNLENELAAREKEYPSQAKAITSDATVTTLATIVVPVNQSLLVSGYVTARRTSGAAGATNDGAAYRVEFLAKNTAGTAALIGAGTVTVIGESQAGWDVTLVASGNSILVKATGAIANSVLWRWTARSFAVGS